MVKEEFEHKDFPADRLRDLEQDLSEIAVEIVAGGHYHFDDHTPMGTRVPYYRKFLTTYSEENIPYIIAIGLHVIPPDPFKEEFELLLGEKERNSMDLEMDLEARTLGDGKLKPSSIPALAEVIDKYGFKDPTVNYTP